MEIEIINWEPLNLKAFKCESISELKQNQELNCDDNVFAIYYYKKNEFYLAYQNNLDKPNYIHNIDISGSYLKACAANINKIEDYLMQTTYRIDKKLQIIDKFENNQLYYYYKIIGDLTNISTIPHLSEIESKTIRQTDIEKFAEQYISYKKEVLFFWDTHPDSKLTFNAEENIFTNWIPLNL
ncbi:hypothetical protein [Paenibacillus hexagrammi]|uniref:Uncharacterized protein n=1 Tax=Paenibacillus hexagrammi TaxID=2908839 RepID=A0ABY3SFB7_9BACL|nr:hypothetical protein [Paenibacillus sp. YPD9-1]UJF31851.1 hypothetical protein L0M14_19065 [Paenibacillus sp. YPD9-1]